MNVSSVAHRFGSLDPLDLGLRQPGAFGPVAAYNSAKLGGMVVFTELAARLRDSGSSVGVQSLHPGAVRTALFRNLPPLLRHALWPLLLFFKVAKYPWHCHSSSKL